MSQESPSPAAAGQPGRCVRPWGWYETLAEGPAYLVKRLFIESGQRISLQRHGHRSEHWVVVSGSGQLLCGEERIQAQPGTQLIIPVATIHRATADSHSPGLEIIEVQRGSWLSEADIERFEDDYGRMEPAS